MDKIKNNAQAKASGLTQLLVTGRVTVKVDSILYLVSANYGLTLQYTKIGGWSLWNTMNNEPKEIGNQYENKFEIEVGK